MTTALDPTTAARVRFDQRGLIAAIIQEEGTGTVLMLGWMDADALALTLSTGRVVFWSRSRSELWRKGDTSGHTQHVRSVSLDCDGDTVLVTVQQVGPACHRGTHTCFDGGGLPAVQGEAPADATRTNPPHAGGEA